MYVQHGEDIRKYNFLISCPSCSSRSRGEGTFGSPFAWVGALIPRWDPVLGGPNQAEVRVLGPMRGIASGAESRRGVFEGQKGRRSPHPRWIKALNPLDHT